MADVFISYAREQGDFVSQLQAALEQRGRTVWRDKKNIRHGEVFPDEINAGIDAADSFAFVLSPESVVSEWCGKELDHAVRQSKRLIPILRCAVDSATVPEALRSIDWLPFQEHDDFDTAVQDLIATVDDDPVWRHEHTRLLLLAEQWKKELRRSRLLRSSDIREAEIWLTRADVPKKRIPAPAHSEFIVASRRAATQRQRFWIGGVSAVAVGMAVLAVWALVRRSIALSGKFAAQAQEQLQHDPARSVELALQAEDAWGRTDPVRDVLHSLELAVVQADNGWSRTDAAGDALRHAVLAAHARALLQHQHTVQRAAFSPSGQFVLTVDGTSTARVWDVHTRTPPVQLDAEGSVVSAQFSPAGDLVVTASGRGEPKARVWDTATWTLLTEVPSGQHSGHTQPMTGAAFSPDGQCVVTASYDGTARVWNARTGDLVSGPFTSTPKAVVTTAVFSATGNAVVTGTDDGAVQVWDVAGCSISGSNASAVAPWKRSPQGAGRVYSIDVSFDGTLIVTASNDGARVWKMSTGEATLLPSSGAVARAAFSADGRYVVTAGRDSTARIWDAQTGRLHKELSGHTLSVVDASFGAGDRFVVTASEDFTARVWDVATGHEVSGLRGHTAAVRAAGFDREGTHVITASEDATARVWDVAIDDDGIVFRANHSTVIRSAALSSRASLLATADDDGVAHLWDLEAKRQIAQLDGQSHQPIETVVFSPDATHVLTAGDDGTARLWDVGRRELVAAFPPDGPGPPLHSAAFSTDGRFVVTASDTMVRVWEAGDRHPVRSIEASEPGKAFLSAAFSPDGRLVSTTSEDTTARLWETGTGKPVAKLEHKAAVHSAAVSPDGAVVVTGDEQSAWIWEAHSGWRRRELPGHSHPVYAVAFNREGTLVVTADDSTAHVWDVATWTELCKLHGEGPVFSAAFAVDGMSVVTASGDRSARVYARAAFAPLAELRHMAQQLTQASFVSTTLTPRGVELHP